MSDASPGSPVFTAEHVLEYAYKRSVGDVLSRFFTDLRDRKISGIRTADGKVQVPPSEYDPATGVSLSELVEVGPGGVVTTWAWVHEPRSQHVLDKPFAWALIRLDGADTGLLHAVDAGHEDAMATGMRVTPRWREETVGEIQDIECFVPESGS